MIECPAIMGGSWFREEDYLIRNLFTISFENRCKDREVSPLISTLIAELTSHYNVNEIFTVLSPLENTMIKVCVYSLEEAHISYMNSKVISKVNSFEKLDNVITSFFNQYCYNLAAKYLQIQKKS